MRRYQRVMQRTIVQIARIRLGDVQPGDIINAKPEDEIGWFEIQVLRQLPSGELIANGATQAQAAKGMAWDLVGVQITKQIEMPTRAPAHTALTN